VRRSSKLERKFIRFPKPIDPTYFDVARSDDPLIVQITQRAGRGDDKKRALYRRIPQLSAAKPGVRPQDVMVALSGNARVDGSFGDPVAAGLADHGRYQYRRSLERYPGDPARPRARLRSNDKVNLILLVLALDHDLWFQSR
jgi:hypothetical protein